MYLRNNNDLGGTLPEARQVLDGHNGLLNELQMKGAEIDALLRSVNPLCDMAEEAQAHEVQMKGDNLHEAFQKLRRALGDRVELMQTYVRLHSLAVQVQEAWNDVEAKCSVPDVPVRDVEESWINGQQKFLQLSQMGRNFMADALGISDRFLDIRKACLCVEGFLEYLAGRQLAVHQLQETWTETVTTVQQTRTVIQSVLESHKDAELFPMLPSVAGQVLPSCTAMLDKIEIKSDRIVARMEEALGQLDAESKKLTTDPSKELDLMIQRMQFRLKEYRTLVQMSEVLFKNLSEVDNMVSILDGKERQKGGGAFYRSVAEVDGAIAEHQVARSTVNDLLKITRQEAAQLVDLLRKQEPAGVAQPDVDTIEAYLKTAEDQWNRSCADEEARLAGAQQRCQFNDDLHAIHLQLDDLSRQLATMTASLLAGGSSLASARLTSEAFLNFEKTIQLLEVRIGTFFSTARKMAGSDMDAAQKEMDQIDRKWSTFHREVDETRKRIDASLELSTLVDEAEQSIRQGGQLLVTLARRSAGIRSAAEAEELIREVDRFVKPHEAKTDEKMKKISQLFVQLYGRPEEEHPLRNECRTMMESFAVINTELSALALNLKAVDEDRQTKAAVQESLEAARSEAAAARAAAAAADEARRAAESAAAAMKEDWNLAQQLTPPRPPLPAEMDEIPRPSQAPTPPSRSRPTMKETYQMEGPMFVSLLQDAAVQESQAVQLICQVTGRPLPDVVWLKDGVDIANNPDYQTECRCSESGTILDCTLTIDETFADDSGRFTCQASNPAGFAQTTATLMVQGELLIQK